MNTAALNICTENNLRNIVLSVLTDRKKSVFEENVNSC